MSRRDEQDESEAFEGNDLRGAMKKLAKGSMKFAFGFTEDNKPILLMHRSKSARALGKELKEGLGASKTTHGVASAEGEALVLDVEGPKVTGMKKAVKLVLRREKITAYTETRLRVGGEEAGDDDEGEGAEGAIDPELAAMRDALDERGAEVTAIVQRLGQGDPADRAALLDYCKACAELERRARDCTDTELQSFARSSAGRAKKIAGLLKAAGAGAAPVGAGAAPGGAGAAPGGARGGAPGMPAPPTPASGLYGSVGKGGKNSPADVCLVQELLCGQGHRVQIDGTCGPGLIAAIMAFQRARLGMADGLIEPGRNTWRLLCGQAPVQPKPYPKPQPKYPPQYEQRSHEPLQYERGGGYAPSKVERIHGVSYTEVEGAPVERINGGGYREVQGGPEERINGGGYSQVEDSGPTKISGSAYSAKGPDGEVQILSGSIEADDDGNVAASGFISQSKADGETNTLGGVEYKHGVFQDGDSWWAGEKAGVVGAKKEIDFAEKFGLNGGHVLKADGAAGTASADAWVSDEGAAAGLQANVGEASATIGSEGTGDRDGTVRFGVSEGAGLAGRLHWADKDKDGNPEFGVGADFGPVSFDVKTEDPLRWVGENNGPLGPLNTVIGGFDDSNMTNDALGGAASAGEAVGGIANEIFGD